MEKISGVLRGLKGKKLAVLGLAFKPQTDDLRDAPSLRLIRLLKEQGARIVAYDPVAERKAREILPGVTFCDGLYDALKGVDAIIVATEWPEFRELDLDRARKLAKGSVLFDGRNIYDPKRVKEAGFRYIGVGR
jgi:UDPglucose 6-dehydrogenase